MEPIFYTTPAEFRACLEKHGETARQLLVGFYKRGSGRQSITWPESVDEALCCGWIDGVRRSIDGSSYSIRFTPRKRRSTWSAVNVRRAQEFTAQGRMKPAGLAAFATRTEDNSGIYSYEQREKISLERAYLEKLRANLLAWTSFQPQSPWYQRTAAWWIESAKKDDTRLKRLAQLIDSSEREQHVAPLRRSTTSA